MKRNYLLLMIASMLMMLLLGCNSGSKAKIASSKYNVSVYVNTDGGNPIADVKVQACDDSVCKVVDTDVNGFAGFNMERNAVDIHILKVPDGFKADSNIVFSTDENGVLTIILEAE